ncbi:MAG TPA: cyanophycin synthetase, partial [Syntrophales bacterium]|jgi:dihydrofolate synthase/folylpolyglutamate synthase|nr:cyanophycin synthetase [Syntrophales bacterium]
VRWEGRLEILRRDPAVLVDGAHNPAGIGSLCRALRHDFSYRRLIVLFGVLRDKHYEEMLERLAALTPLLIITRPGSERSLPPESLLEAAKRLSPEAKAIPAPAAALRHALAVARHDDLICVTGSLYLVGEIKRLFLTGDA